MTIEEIREIKERTSLEAIKLSGEEYINYYRTRARELQDKIDKIRESSKKASD